MPSVCLALETSTATCSVALAVDGVVIEDTRALGRTHNEHLLGMIDGLCARADVTPGQLDTVVYSAGPGSFTGVRIAASAAMAIALACKARLLSVNSLLALAAQAIEDTPATSDMALLSLRRSRKGAYYLCAYRLSGHRLTQVLPPRLVTSRPELPALASPPSALDGGAAVSDRWLLVGDEWPWAPDEAIDVSRCGTAPSASVLVSMQANPLFSDHVSASGSASGLPVYVGGADGGDHPWRFANQ